MRFAIVPVAEAEGAVLAHSVGVGDGRLKKGRILSGADLAALSAAGATEVMAARLEPGDVAEDEAARRVAAAIAGPGTATALAFTGRANIHAAAAGIVVIDRDRLIALNAIDEGLTVATLAPFDTVMPEQMLATVKIIPFALSENVLAEAEAILKGASHLISVAPFTARSAALILTRVDGTRASLIDKRIKVIGDRLERLGSKLGKTIVVAHEIAAVREAVHAQATAGLEPLLVFGASAIVDRGDVIPAAIVSAGGIVDHLGMPVDPGNLLLVGRLRGATVIGVPSCASSPKLNGFDWVLGRVLAGLPVGRAEIVGMAPGGLLMEIPTRPQPRRG